MTPRAWTITALCLITTCYVASLTLSVVSGEFPLPGDWVTPVWYGFTLVGGLIALRRPDNRIAWICMAIGLSWGLEGVMFGLYFQDVAFPGSSDGPVLWAVIADPLWIFGVFMIATFVLMLFPDGRLPSSRWRWLPWTVGLAMVVLYPLVVFTSEETASYGRPHVDNPLVESRIGEFLLDSGLSIAITPPLVVVLFCGVAASITALVVRYRRAKGTERQQLKWLVTAGIAAVLVFVVAIFVVDYFGDLVGLVAGAGLGLIPVSIGVAVFRYRLYDLDRLLSRTVSYSLVVGVLAAVYGAIVIWLPLLIPVSLDSPLLVAGGTLTVAALFNPMRGWILALVDRRFYRSRYDAQVEIDRFSHDLRNAIDAESVRGDLIEVASKTMAPTILGLWIRDESRTDGADVTRRRKSVAPSD